ncbi:conserved hypothetical protein [Ricinus communis]|uniref:NAC domain-containing protein n=1 Tax=Ricinus communis TaxID=3988 RepID=B9T5V1_RICCO|nr:conserved hypothetical protein [Ricinus communis]
MMQETQNTSSPWANMAVGLRFCPTEKQLVAYYLHGKNNGRFSSVENQLPVKYCDFYGKEEPWEIWEKFDGDKLSDHESLYFFTTLKKVTPGRGHNISRRIGSTAGTWHGETSGNSSRLHHNGVTAYMKRFNYRNPSRLDQDRCWNMLEYSLEGGESRYVICQLKKSRKQSKKRKSQTVDDDFVQVLEPVKRLRIEQELPKDFQENPKAVDVVPAMHEQDVMATMRNPLPYNSDEGDYCLGDNQVNDSEPDMHSRAEEELIKLLEENLQENQNAAVDIVHSTEKQDAMAATLAMPVPLPDDFYLDLFNFDDYFLRDDPNVSVEASEIDKRLRVEEELPTNIDKNQQAADAVVEQELQNNFQENKHAADYMEPTMEEQELKSQENQGVAVHTVPAPDILALAASMPWPSGPEDSIIVNDRILDHDMDPAFYYDDLFGGYMY